MRYLSVCSGIESASVAWEPLGWTPVAFSEIEEFPCRVLKHRFPNVPNLGDMTKFHEWPDFEIDLIVGGTPCQAFSIAGLRKGLDDPRGNLTLTFLGVVARYLPRIVLWENVPGVLSSTNGEPKSEPPDRVGMVDGERVVDSCEYEETSAFACLLAGLAELGYGVAYRSFDAQYFHLAQRRERVFVVGYIGDWKRAAQALFEPEGVLGHPAPSRGAREETAGTITARTKGGGGLGTDFDLAGGLAVEQDARNGSRLKWPAEIAPTLNAAFGKKQGLEDQHVNGGADGSFRIAGTLTSRDYKSVRMDADTNHLIPMRRGGFFDGRLTLAMRGRDGLPSLEIRQDETANAILTPNGGRGGIGVGAVAIPIQEPNARTGKSTSDATHGIGIGGPNDPMFTLNTKQHGVGYMPARSFGADGGVDERFAEREVCDALHTTSGAGNKAPVIAFGSKDHGADAGEICPTLRAGAHANSHANGGVMPAVAFHPTQDPISSTDGSTHAMGTGSAGGTATVAALAGMSVRRLTPVECERLQGLPDNWTLIPGDYRERKPEDRIETVAYLIAHGFTSEEAEQLADCPDGPRYKAIGNSMAGTVMRWLGRRIAWAAKPRILEID